MCKINACFTVTLFPSILEICDANIIVIYIYLEMKEGYFYKK